MSLQGATHDVNYELLNALYQREVTTGIRDFAPELSKLNLKQSLFFWNYALAHNGVIHINRVQEDALDDLAKKSKNDDLSNHDEELNAQVIAKIKEIKSKLAPIIKQHLTNYNRLKAEQTSNVQAEDHQNTKPKSRYST